MKTLILTIAHPDYGITGRTMDSLENMRIGMGCGLFPYHPLYREPDAHQDVTAHMNKGREIVLSAGFDALMTIEADMIVPPDAWEKLAALDCDIAYGLYCLRHRPMRWNVAENMTPLGYISLTTNGLDNDIWGKTIDCAGVGFGCTLIKRRVLEAYEFQLFEDKPRMFHCDYKFAWDSIGKFEQRADLSVVCGHIDMSKEVIYWPVMDKPYFRQEKIEEFNYGY